MSFQLGAFLSGTDAVVQDSVPCVQHIAAEVSAVPRAVLAVQGFALQRPNVRFVPTQAQLKDGQNLDVGAFSPAGLEVALDEVIVPGLPFLVCRALHLHIHHHPSPVTCVFSPMHFSQTCRDNVSGRTNCKVVCTHGLHFVLPQESGSLDLLLAQNLSPAFGESFVSGRLQNNPQHASHL